jgi:hypothetical protein
MLLSWLALLFKAWRKRVKDAKQSKDANAHRYAT